MIGVKADKEEIRKIANEKTNKSDSEHQMQLVETMHKMLKNVAVLVTELTKQGIWEKAENEASVEKRNRYLLDQAMSIERWIESIDIRHVEQRIAQSPNKKH